MNNLSLRSHGCCFEWLWKNILTKIRKIPQRLPENGATDDVFRPKRTNIPNCCCKKADLKCKMFNFFFDVSTKHWDLFIKCVFSQTVILN